VVAPTASENDDFSENDQAEDGSASETKEA
jgi:hypothetical protein